MCTHFNVSLVVRSSDFSLIMYVDKVGDVHVGGTLVGKDDGPMFVDGRLERPVGTFRSMVGEDLRLEVPALPPHLPGIHILQNGTLGHYHYIDLGLAAAALFLCRVVPGRRLDGEIPLVRLHRSLQGIAVVPLSHRLAKLIDHRPGP